MAQQTFAQQLEKANSSNPFMLHNNIRALELTEEYALVEARVKPESLNAMGGLHGGLMMVMAEIACGLLARSDGRKYVTLDSSFRFIAGSTGAESARARAQITKRGRTVCFAKAQVTEGGTGKLLAEGEFTFYCLGE